MFATNFKPTFRACDLALFCMAPSEKTEIEFVLKYFPFSKFKPRVKKTLKNHLEEIRPKDKEIIVKEWTHQAQKGNVKFDDEKVINKVSECINKNYEIFFDEDSDETKFIRYANLDLLTTSKENVQTDFNMHEQLYKDKLNYELEMYKSTVKKTVHLERGILFEKNIIDMINKKENADFIQDKALKSTDFGLFKICGILDGVDWKKRTIIEVKTRNFIFKDKKTISLREKLQCLCYMKLNECDKCILVESDSNGEHNMIKIDWDEQEFEERVLSKLRDFVIKYRTIEEEEFKSKVCKYSCF